MNGAQKTWPYINILHQSTLSKKSAVPLFRQAEQDKSSNVE